MAVFRLPRPDPRCAAGARPAQGERRSIFQVGAVAPVEQPVVQAIAAALPELDLVRLDAVAAPVRRPRRLLAVALPGASMAASRTWREATSCSALTPRPRAARRAGASRSKHRTPPRRASAPCRRCAPAARAPTTGRRGTPRRAARARALAAEVVGVEEELPALDALQKHDARRWRARGRHGGEGHRVRQRQPGAQRVVEPALELADRIGIGLRFGESGAHVFLAQVGDVHARDSTSRRG